MNLFKRKPEGFIYSIPQSDPFDGIQIKVATYQDKEAEAGIKKILKQSSIKEIQFCKIPGHEGLKVLADGYKVGTIWRSSWTGLYDKVKNQRINRAFLSVSDDVYLFIN